MAFSTALFSNKFATGTLSFSRHSSSQIFCLRLSRKDKALAIVRAQQRKMPGFLMTRSLLESNIGGNGNEAAEPARILLERLFVQREKLEEQMSKDSCLSKNVGINLKVLESDLKSALVALRKREKDLEDAERGVLLDHAKLNCAKQDLEQREEELAAVCAMHKKLEVDMMKANKDLVSQVRQIEDLKLLVKKQDREIVDAQSILSLKERELDKMRDELRKKNEDASRINSDLNTRDQQLEEANAVIEKQQVTIQDLERLVKEKEHELAASVQFRQDEEEKLKVVETNLQKRTVEWLLAREELTKLVAEASKNMKEIKDSLDDLKIVRKLLADVRVELISSQESLASSRTKMEDQEQQLKSQLVEVNELKLIVMSHANNLKEAQLEVRSERAKLRLEQVRSKELQSQIQKDQDLIGILQQDLKNAKSSLQKATQEKALLQEELEKKTREFSDAWNLLQVRESELEDARLQIQHLKSEQAYFQPVLEMKDADLQYAQEKLDDLNYEAAELKRQLKSKDDELVKANTDAWEKEVLVQKMQHELDDTKQKFSDAATVVEQVSELSNKLIVSINDENGSSSLGLLDYESVQPVTECELWPLVEKPVPELWMVKQLEAELEMSKHKLKERETELLAVQQSLADKDEKLKAVLDGWNAREFEIERVKEEMREEADDLKKLHALAELRGEGSNMADLAIEKLQLEVAHLEVEAATSALRNLADMSQKLLKETKTVRRIDDVIFQTKQAETCNDLQTTEHFEVAQREVARVTALTEQLVREAGLSIIATSKEES